MTCRRIIAADVAHYYCKEEICEICTYAYCLSIFLFILYSISLSVSHSLFLTQTTYCTFLSLSPSLSSLLSSFYNILI